ncbi:MAG: ABC transporter ATP-binding protein/permease [Candidatus Heimdallarchaeota archaeon]|nr:ABC transporter ATP-binding protein/permease [Candidatus Heimdallarchaeota archaeon]
MSTLQLEMRKIPNSEFKWLVQRIFQKPAMAITVIAGILVSIGLTMAVPYLTGRMFNRLWAIYLKEQPAVFYVFFRWFFFEYEILKYVAAILLLGAINFLISIIVGILNEYLAQNAERQIREDFYASVQNKSMAFFDTAKVGELMSQATYDVRIINATISPGFRMITQAVISALVTFGLIFWLEPYVMIIVIFFFPFYIITLRSYAKKLSPLTQKVQQQFGICNAHLQENVSGVRVIRAFTGETFEIKKFGKEVDTLRDDIIKRGVQQARYFPPLLLSFTITLALGLSIYFIIIGRMDGGEAITILGVLIQLYNPTYQISWVLYLTHMGLAGARRILRTMKEEDIIIEKPDAIELPEIRGRIEYRNVSFSYQRQQLQDAEENKSEENYRPTLRDISFVAEPGEIVAILGPTGCGKSTLTKLLARMYDVDKGTILIDGYDIRNVTLESLRKNIGVIEQDIFLFSTTIKENIAYGAEREISDEEIIEYAKAAQAHEFIMSFKDGYDTLVGERGVTLSGGQKQRIAIARAFLANPKILILDDSASAIDAKTEEQIQKAMNNLLKNRTVFIITHRLATIKRADKIIVMRKGRIVAKGDHDELLRTSEDYRRIFGRHIKLPPIQKEAIKATGGAK